MVNSKQPSIFVDLKAFRICNGLTQKDIADYLQVSTAFVSRVESGQNKLPSEQFVKLMENNRGWDTELLTASHHQKYDITHGDKHIGNSFENAYHPTINTFQGYSQEDVEREVHHRLKLKEQEIQHLKEKLEDKENQIAYLKSDLQWHKDMLDEYRAGKNPSGSTKSEEN